MAFTGRTLAVAAALCATMAPQAHAATSTAGDDPAVVNGALEAVGGILGRFRIEGQVNTLYDSNMQRLGDGFPPTPGTPKSDWRIAPAVTVSTNLPIGRQQLSLNGTLGRDFYVNGTRPDRTRYNVGGALNWRLGSRCSGVVDASFSSRQLLLSEASQNLSNVQENLNYGASANCQTVTGFGFGAAISQNNLRNSDPSRESFDVDSTVFSPQLSYGTPSLGQFSLTGSYNQSTYPQRFIFETDGNLVEEGVDIVSGRFGYRRGLGSRLSISLGLSYFNVKPQPKDALVPLAPVNPGDPVLLLPVTREASSNLGYDVGLSYRSGSRLSGRLSASRQATASANVGARSQVVQSYALDIDYQVSQSIMAGTGITYDQRDYKNSFSSPDEPLRRLQDKISRVFASLSYAPVDLYSVGLEVSYQDRKSDPVEYSFDSFAALLRLRVSFGR